MITQTLPLCSKLLFRAELVNATATFTVNEGNSELQLGAVRGYSGNMPPPICLHYDFDRFLHVAPLTFKFGTRSRSRLFPHVPQMPLFYYTHGQTVIPKGTDKLCTLDCFFSRWSGVTLHVFPCISQTDGAHHEKTPNRCQNAHLRNRFSPHLPQPLPNTQLGRTCELAQRLIAPCFKLLPSRTTESLLKETSTRIRPQRDYEGCYSWIFLFFFLYLMIFHTRGFTVSLGMSAFFLTQFCFLLVNLHFFVHLFCMSRIRGALMKCGSCFGFPYYSWNQWQTLGHPAYQLFPPFGQEVHNKQLQIKNKKSHVVTVKQPPNDSNKQRRNNKLSMNLFTDSSHLSFSIWLFSLLFTF